MILCSIKNKRPSYFFSLEYVLSVFINFGHFSAPSLHRNRFLFKERNCKIRLSLVSFRLNRGKMLICTKKKCFMLLQHLRVWSRQSHSLGRYNTTSPWNDQWQKENWSRKCIFHRIKLYNWTVHYSYKASYFRSFGEDRECCAVSCRLTCARFLISLLVIIPVSRRLLKIKLCPWGQKKMERESCLFTF